MRYLTLLSTGPAPCLLFLKFLIGTHRIMIDTDDVLLRFTVTEIPSYLISMRISSKAFYAGCFMAPYHIENHAWIDNAFNMTI